MRQLSSLELSQITGGLSLTDITHGAATGAFLGYIALLFNRATATQALGYGAAIGAVIPVIYTVARCIDSKLFDAIPSSTDN